MRLRDIAKRFEELMAMWDCADDRGDDQAMLDISTRYSDEVKDLAKMLEKAGYFNEVSKHDYN